MCAHHVSHVHPFLFLLYSHKAYPSHIWQTYEVIDDVQAKPNHACYFNNHIDAAQGRRGKTA